MAIKSKTALSALVVRLLDLLLAQDIDGWVELWADDGVFEFPFSPPGYNKRVEGKRAIAAYMSGFPDKIKIASFDVITLIHNDAGTEGFLEFTCKGAAVQTGLQYNQHYVALLKLDADGKLLLYRDFWNPLVAIEAFGGAEAFTKSLSGGEA